MISNQATVSTKYCMTVTKEVITMISAGDFRNGVTFEMDGQVVSIIEFQHVSRVRVPLL